MLPKIVAVGENNPLLQFLRCVLSNTAGAGESEVWPLRNNCLKRQQSVESNW